jgi:hypothetical protein
MATARQVSTVLLQRTAFFNATGRPIPIACAMQVK